MPTATTERVNRKFGLHGYDDGGGGGGGDDDGDGAEDVDDSHKDECFICKDGGELVRCDEPDCNKAYHAE